MSDVIRGAVPRNHLVGRESALSGDEVQGKTARPPQRAVARLCRPRCTTNVRITASRSASPRPEHPCRCRCRLPQSSAGPASPPSTAGAHALPALSAALRMKPVVYPTRPPNRLAVLHDRSLRIISRNSPAGTASPGRVRHQGASRRGKMHEVFEKQRAGSLLPPANTALCLYYSTTTFEACRPFGPRTTSNSTAAPSASDRKPPP
jgi:hypothetical protein